MWNVNMYVLFVFHYSVFPRTLCSSAEALDCPFSLDWPVIHSAWRDCSHILFIEQHSVYVLWIVCLCFSEGMCSEYAVLAFPRPFKSVKQKIKALLKPQLCFQDVITDLTANKTGLLRLTISNYQSALAFTGEMGILPVLHCCWYQPLSCKDAHDYQEQCLMRLCF